MNYTGLPLNIYYTFAHSVVILNPDIKVIFSRVALGEKNMYSVKLYRQEIAHY